VLHGILERISGLLDDRGPLQLDHRFLDIGVDAREYAGEQIVAEKQSLGSYGLTVVIAMV